VVDYYRPLVLSLRGENGSAIGRGPRGKRAPDASAFSAEDANRSEEAGDAS
jgi:hypothetical protein